MRLQPTLRPQILILIRRCPRLFVSCYVNWEAFRFILNQFWKRYQLFFQNVFFRLKGHQNGRQIWLQTVRMQGEQQYKIRTKCVQKRTIVRPHSCLLLPPGTSSA